MKLYKKYTFIYIYPLEVANCPSRFKSALPEAWKSLNTKPVFVCLNGAKINDYLYPVLS